LKNEAEQVQEFAMPEPEVDNLQEQMEELHLEASE
jgi:hypothetical protein